LTLWYILAHKIKAKGHGHGHQEEIRSRFTESAVAIEHYFYTTFGNSAEIL
jgi:hypothetical protein